MLHSFNVRLIDYTLIPAVPVPVSLIVVTCYNISVF